MPLPDKIIIIVCIPSLLCASQPRSLLPPGRSLEEVYPCTISFIVPALNEERVVESVIEQIAERVDGRFSDHEIILVNDGSTDRTGEIMEWLVARIPKTRVIHNEQNVGFGMSFRQGLQAARFDYVMLLCGDGGLPASSLPPIFEKIGSVDIVVPWMINLKQIKTPFRYALSRTYTHLLNWIFGIKLHYYNGLPVHRRDLLQQINVASAGFGFQAEILVKLIKSGCSYVQVGVHGAERTNRSSAMRISNWLSVGHTIAHLLRELARFEPVPPEIVARRPRGSARIPLSSDSSKH